jgi:hypothetical protein
MRYAFPAALLALAAASPASATGGFLCSPIDGTGPGISLVIGHGIPSGVIGAALKENGRWRSSMQAEVPMVLQRTWIDKERTWVDIIHRQTGAPEAQLRVRNQGFGGTGTLVRKGRTYQVRCRQD